MNTAEVSKMSAQEWRKQYLKDYAAAHKEQTNASKKRWREKNRQHTRDYAKKYYSTHKEEYANRYEENREAKTKSSKEYHKSANGRKKHQISYWKRRGLIHDDFETLYDEYLNKKKCDKCDEEFGERGDGTGTYRCIAQKYGSKEVDGVCCYKCMNRDKVVAKMNARKSALNICIKPSKTPTETQLPLTEK
jgi:hypothetical protein